MKLPTLNRMVIIGLAFLILIASGVWAYIVFFVPPVPISQQPTTAQPASEPKPSESTRPTGKYADLTGDAFDEAYIADMIAHHEGAINMSEQAQSVTTREDIRAMAAEITYAQSVEMIKMAEWQKAWGYDPTMGKGHNSHSGEGLTMAGDMVEMQNKLKGLTGEAYDEEFLKQMIIHHKQAVEMSKNATINAKHQEVKELAEAVIRDQTAEIVQMQQWQKAWGHQKN